MSSIVNALQEKKLIDCPKFLGPGMQYEVIMGSEAYGCADTTRVSDRDVYGFTIPPIEWVFPTTAGEVPLFSHEQHKFENYQKHHIKDTAMEYDLDVYNIARYFRLLTNNVPNVLDSLFVPDRCVLLMTPVGKMVKDNRRLFLSKNVYNSFFGFANGQWKKIKAKTPEEGSKRWELVQQFGYDVKFAYHIVRLANECEQLLCTGEMDMERDREIYKAIRRGEWTVDQIFTYMKDLEFALKSQYDSESCPLPYAPDEAKVRDLLMNCLEQHFGSLDKVLVREDRTAAMGDEITTVVKRYIGNRR